MYIGLMKYKFCNETNKFILYDKLGNYIDTVGKDCFISLYQYKSKSVELNRWYILKDYVDYTEGTFSHVVFVNEVIQTWNERYFYPKIENVYYFDNSRDLTGYYKKSHSN